MNIRWNKKSGNSDVTTIPAEIKEQLGVNTGDSISYELSEYGSVYMLKATDNSDFDKIVDSVIN